MRRDALKHRIIFLYRIRDYNMDQYNLGSVIDSV